METADFPIFNVAVRREQWEGNFWIQFDLIFVSWKKIEKFEKIGFSFWVKQKNDDSIVCVTNEWIMNKYSLIISSENI